MNKKVIQGIKTKKRIIECARKLFREKGYYAVTVDDIIKEANSSKGGFYTHFKTKEQLLFDMAPLLDDAYNAFLKTDMKAETAIERIYLFIRYVFKIIEDEIGLEFISAIYASQIKDLTSEHLLTAQERGYYHVLETLVEEGFKNNEFKTELSAKTIISFFTTCIRGAIYDWCLQNGGFDLTDYGGEIIRMMINQVKSNQTKEEI